MIEKYNACFSAIDNFSPKYNNNSKRKYKDILFNKIIAISGGYVNELNNYGAINCKKKFGVSESLYKMHSNIIGEKPISLFHITELHAKRVFNDMYYLPLKCNLMPVGVDFILMHTAIDINIDDVVFEIARMFAIRCSNKKNDDILNEVLNVFQSTECDESYLLLISKCINLLGSMQYKRIAKGCIDGEIHNYEKKMSFQSNAMRFAFDIVNESIKSRSLRDVSI